MFLISNLVRKKTSQTFIMRRMVLQTMRRRIKFSKGGEVTRRHMLNRTPDSASGTYTSIGLACITKLMHDF